MALIRKRYHYEMFSFDHGRNIKITKKNVENLYNFGYTFYPPFAHDEIITNKKALHFCFKNLGRDIFNVILFIIGSILVSFFLPFGINLIFNKIIPTFNISLFHQVVLGLFITAISGGIFAFISSFSILRLQSIIRAKFQTALWDRLLRLPLQFFRKFGIGDLQRRAFELFEIQRILSSAFLTSLLFGLFSLMYLFVMFYFSPLLALVGLGTVTLIVSTIIFFLIKKIELDTKVLNELGTFNSFMLQIISGIEKIRFTESETILFSKWSDKYLDIKDKSLKANSYANIMQVLNSALLILGVIVTFLVGLQLINKTLSLGSFIAFNSAFGAFSMAIYSATYTMINYFGMIIPRWKRSKVILEHKTEIEEGKIDPLILEGFVELDNVCFKYDEESPLVLNQVSLKANPGEFIAIVGPTNSGKSSIFKLLLKHYVPQSGSISIDNKELNDLDIFKLRRQIGTVLQESEIISGTIEDNLFIHDEASYKQALEIMKITEFDEILKTLPLGIKTYIADKGKNFSGGQKQQLLLTRALIRQPKILLLDEATCYLDNKLQKSISSHIEKLKMTRIVISHRLDTIALADRIYIIIKGKIVDVGTFDELIKRNQFFANLVEKQNL
ncbi:MAG: ATP-binding cassette domain-containing protein [Chlamydiae bacterium]|nr:ATP-binding cassette domain-containing protein [Chlamydiota bacterium]